MKRLHIHLNVKDLENSIQFYNRLFAVEPTLVKDDYAKWMLDDPRVNFAISTRSRKSGLDHLGLQAESEGELEQIHEAMRHADQPVVNEPGATCCYARSNKHWTVDPDGVAWEGFHSLESIPTYGKEEPSAEKEDLHESGDKAACCINKIKPESAGRCC
ncbi:glyoxalase/bleomycin resistance/dioxygenase family protein [Hahella sp. CCB-MM4]|uniref:ArsI/CadI family heavy metal resistance metalloenzyme n=1 Tax=Hahella sp. (strain CCB-MM4) TaxID=1926491 RepID=UPI000B9B4BE5|nr:ArsI/CadI family heavy metal resistance metalloenzyme [Hahella sp. CCB-MM4]OZG73747.1 glyoxalase/bleomycin resistance/dioxygenase family protein [Hahella sp. CCB-MM4]